MKKKKVFVLLPDGVGLRNFAYSKFYEIGKQFYDISFWNNTPFNLSDLNYSEIKFDKPVIHSLSDVVKNGLIQASLTKNKKVEKDSVYDTYRFPASKNGLKNKIKNSIVAFINSNFSHQNGVLKLRRLINSFERKTSYYKHCKSILEKEKPDFIFCTNQRPIVAVAPLLAAKDLNIPTATFIFSWDNLPKATMVVQTDYYFVWSEHMKNELMHYHPEINSNQILITGTPQFEAHFDQNLYQEKEVFFNENKLDHNKKYICYSGDDITTCPDDEKYLRDVALAVRALNKKGHNLGLIFRRCPVDFSTRYDAVLQEFKDVIVPVNPAWIKIGEGWNTVLPTIKDNQVLINTIKHSELVINLGSSMVFDFAVFNKPCFYINYDVTNKLIEDWSVKKIYNFVHFRSMSNKKAVVWVNSPNEYEKLIEENLNKNVSEDALKWFQKITEQPADKASERIWNAINTLI